jgi:hypothetical protein
MRLILLLNQMYNTDEYMYWWWSRLKCVYIIKENKVLPHENFIIYILNNLKCVFNSDHPTDTFSNYKVINLRLTEQSKKWTQDILEDLAGQLMKVLSVTGLEQPPSLQDILMRLVTGASVIRVLQSAKWKLCILTAQSHEWRWFRSVRFLWEVFWACVIKISVLQICLVWWKHLLKPNGTMKWQ